MQQYHPVNINHIVASAPTGTANIWQVPVDWDIRYPPRRTARVAGRAISTHHLRQPATFPGLMSLHIVSDLLTENWAITAHNLAGVTVEDVLTAIHRALQAPLTQYEWECMSPTQRTRVERMFYTRCEASRDFERTRYGGVLRMDCLLHTTVFVGLSSLMFRNNRWEIVLTLSRNFGAHGRGQSRLP